MCTLYPDGGDWVPLACRAAAWPARLWSAGVLVPIRCCVLARAGTSQRFGPRRGPSLGRWAPWRKTGCARGGGRASVAGLPGARPDPPAAEAESRSLGCLAQDRIRPRRRPSLGRWAPWRKTGSARGGRASVAGLLGARPDPPAAEAEPRSRGCLAQDRIRPGQALPVELCATRAAASGANGPPLQALCRESTAPGGGDLTPATLDCIAGTRPCRHPSGKRSGIAATRRGRSPGERVARQRRHLVDSIPLNAAPGTASPGSSRFPSESVLRESHGPRDVDPAAQGGGGRIGGFRLRVFARCSSISCSNRLGAIVETGTQPLSAPQ